MRVCLTDFLDSCRARGLRHSTIEGHYRPVLTEFIEWCEAQGVTEVAQLSRAVVNRWTIGLHDRQTRQGQRWSPQTVKNHVEKVNTWLNWLRREAELLEKDVSGRRPRVPHRYVDVLTPADVERLRKAAASGPNGLRNAVILQLLWETGMRRGELAGLRLDDVRVIGRQRFLRVCAREHGGGSKGTDDRLVPLPHAWPELRTYLEHRPASSSDALLLASHRSARTGQYEGLSGEGIQEVIQQAAREAGMSKRVHPHLFRHSMATYCLERGMNPIHLAAILGHSTLKQLQRTYAHPHSSALHADLARVLVAR